MTTNNTTDLTICTVSFRSKGHIELNWRLVEHLNTISHPQWLIAQNTPPEENESIELPSDRCRVVDGYPFEPSVKRPASAHHARSLNKLISLVETQFLLILDPDFYIICQEWVGCVTHHMRAKGLALFGAPYNPKWHTKYRYFPSLHCMFVDLARIGKDELDCTPGNIGSDGRQNQLQPFAPRMLVSWEFWATLPQRMQLLASPYTPHVISSRRNHIGVSRDTGYKFYRRYRARDRIGYESVTPIYRPAYSILDLFIPDDLSYVPKRRNSFTARGFKEMGITDTTHYGWEEYVWQGRPFGFHIRGFMSEHDSAWQVNTASEVLAQLTGLNNNLPASP